MICFQLQIKNVPMKNFRLFTDHVRLMFRCLLQYILFSELISGVGCHEHHQARHERAYANQPTCSPHFSATRLTRLYQNNKINHISMEYLDLISIEFDFVWSHSVQTMTLDLYVISDSMLRRGNETSSIHRLMVNQVL